MASEPCSKQCNKHCSMHCSEHMQMHCTEQMHVRNGRTNEEQPTLISSLTLSIAREKRPA